MASTCTHVLDASPHDEYAECVLCGTACRNPQYVNMDGRFTVADMPGVAFWLSRYAREMTEEKWTLDCTEDHEHEEVCYLYDEPESVEDRTKVIAVMVGDDREHIVDVDDLTEISVEDYCAGCGQIGPNHCG